MIITLVVVVIYIPREALRVPLRFCVGDDPEVLEVLDFWQKRNILVFNRLELYLQLEEIEHHG